MAIGFGVQWDYFSENGCRITPQAGASLSKKRGDMIVDEHDRQFVIQRAQPWRECIKGVIWNKLHITCRPA